MERHGRDEVEFRSRRDEERSSWSFSYDDDNAWLAVISLGVLLMGVNDANSDDGVDSVDVIRRACKISDKRVEFIITCNRITAKIKIVLTKKLMRVTAVMAREQAIAK